MPYLRNFCKIRNTRFSGFSKKRKKHICSSFSLIFSPPFLWIMCITLWKTCIHGIFTVDNPMGFSTFSTAAFPLRNSLISLHNICAHFVQTKKQVKNYLFFLPKFLHFMQGLIPRSSPPGQPDSIPLFFHRSRRWSPVPWCHPERGRTKFHPRRSLPPDPRGNDRPLC